MPPLSWGCHAASVPVGAHGAGSHGGCHTTTEAHLYCRRATREADVLPGGWTGVAVQNDVTQPLKTDEQGLPM
jgi:hypothetical protein